MPGIYAKVAVIDKGHILLAQREDFKTWGFPEGTWSMVNPSPRLL